MKTFALLAATLILLGGCVSQSDQRFTGDNFDRLKASKTRVSLGLTYLKNGNFSQAKFNLDKALGFAPKSAEANFAMAYYYQKVEEQEKAEQAYQLAMELDPNNADIANSYGAFLCVKGDYQKAKTYFLKAVNTSNYISSAQTYENLAICSQSQGQPLDAVEYLRSAVNHQPGRANSLYLLTQALIDTAQYTEARQTLRRYEKVSPVSAQSLLMASKIERGAGNVQGALAYEKMRQQLFATHPIVAKIQDQLQPSSESLVVETSSQVNLSKIQAEVAVTEPKIDSAAETELLPATFHQVVSGENLYRISLLYNIKMQRLIEWNGMTEASAIYNGMKLSLVDPNSVE
jgi:type IV pilus assembly protein PilF